MKALRREGKFNAYAREEVRKLLGAGNCFGYFLVPAIAGLTYYGTPVVAISLMSDGYVELKGAEGKLTIFNREEDLLFDAPEAAPEPLEKVSYVVEVDAAYLSNGYESGWKQYGKESYPSMAAAVDSLKRLLKHTKEGTAAYFRIARRAETYFSLDAAEKSL